MTITISRITATAGICAAVAGTLYAGVQVNHPPADVAHVVTTEMLVRETVKATMAVLALAGFAGMFLHNRRRTRATSRTTSTARWATTRAATSATCRTSS